MSVHVPEAVGSTMLFPVIQECEEGETAWIEETVEGEDEPEHPAPSIRLMAAAASEPTAPASSAEASPIEHGHDDSEPHIDDYGFSSATGMAFVMGAAGLILGLAAGVYLVGYRVVSVDSHVVTGAYTFQVGHAHSVLQEVVQPPPAPSWPSRAVSLALGLGYVTVLAAAGSAAFAWMQRLSPETDALNRVKWLALAAAVAGAIVTVVVVPLHAAEIAGTAEAIANSADLRLAVGTRLGWSALARAGLLVAGALALARWRPSAEAAESSAATDPTPAGVSPPGAAAALLVGAALTFALAGHEATGPRALGVSVVHGVHLAAGALWFGGLAAMAVSLPLFRGSRRSVARSFSGVALWSVAVASSTGFGLTFSHNGGLVGLTNSAYGRTLGLKLALVGLAVAAGAVSRRQAHAAAGIHQNLRRSVGIEVTVICLILFVTGALVTLAPSRAVQAEVRAFSAEEALAGGRLIVVAEPAGGGAAIHVTTIGADGREADLASAVRVRFLLAAHDIGPIERDLERVSAGHFAYSGRDMSLPGRWRIQIRAKVSDFDDEVFVYDVDVGAAD
jgi:copper transport protein